MEAEVKRRPFHYVLRALAFVLVAMIVWAVIGDVDWHGHQKWHTPWELVTFCWLDLMALYLGLMTMIGGIRGWFSWPKRGRRVPLIVEVPDWNLRIHFIICAVFMILLAARDILMRRA